MPDIKNRKYAEEPLKIADMSYLGYTPEQMGRLTIKAKSHLPHSVQIAGPTTTLKAKVCQ